MLKKFFTYTVAITTIMWSMGGMLVLPVSAASAGDLIKLACPAGAGADDACRAVYYIGEDGKKYVFPNQKVYMTWYSNFDDVETVSSTEFLSYPDGGAVAYRPGAKMIKQPGASLPTVYVVGPFEDGKATLWPIASEAAAKEIFGANWNKMIDDLSSFFWGSYSIQDEEVTGLDDYDPSEMKDEASSIGEYMMMEMSDDEDEDNTSNGTLKVQLAAGSPEFIVVPNNVSSLPFTELVFTTTGETVEVEGLTIRRYGVGSKDDFDDVWVVADGRQHGSERSLLSGDYATITFPNDPIVVAPGEPVTVWLMGSLVGEDAIGNYDALGLGSAADVDANGSVSGSFPVVGPMASIATQDAATVTVDEQGSDKTISVGDVQQEVGRFQISVDSPNDLDIKLESITFENKGTVSDLAEVLGNVVVKFSAQTVSKEVVFLDGERMWVDFGGLVFEDGATKSLRILADILSAETSDTIQFEIDDDKDVVATEVSGSLEYGARVEESGVSGTLKNLELKTYTVQTGDINFSSATNPSRNVAPGSKDVVLLEGKITVDTEFDADGLKVRLGTGTANLADKADLEDDWENFSLIIDSTVIDTVDTLTEVSAGGAPAEGTNGDYFDFDTKFNIKPGVHTVRVEADAKNNADVDDAIELFIYSDDLDSPEYSSNGDTVPATELTGTVDGSVVTIKAAVVTVTRNDGNSSESFVGGSKGIEFMKFTIEANDASDVEISSVTLTASSTPNTEYETSDVSNVQLWLDGQKVGSPIDLSSGSFNDINFVVKASQQRQLAISLDTNTVTTTQTLQIGVTDVDATDSEGNTATVNNQSGNALSSGAAGVYSDASSITTLGDFTATVDGNTPDEDILVAKEGVWYSVYTLRLEAQDEELRLTDLFLFNTATNNGATTTGATSTNADARISTLGVFDQAGTLKQEKALSSGALRFDLGTNGAIVVPKDGNTKITVKAKLNSIADGSKTGKTLKLALATTTSPSVKGVVVESGATGSDLTASDITTTSVASDYFILRRTKPTITRFGTPSGQLSSGSDKVIYRFTVSADANEDVAWKAIKFDVTGRFGGYDLNNSTSNGLATSTTNGSGATQQGISGVELYEYGTNQKVQNGSYVVSYGWDLTRDNGEVQIDMNNGIEEVVSNGQSKTYELRATLAGVTADGDFVDVRIDDEADDKANSGDVNYGAVTSDPDRVDGLDNGSITLLNNTIAGARAYSFLWSDYSGSPHSANDEISAADSLDWTNDRLVNIDTSAWSWVASF